MAPEAEREFWSGFTGVLVDETQKASGIELCQLGVPSDESLWSKRLAEKCGSSGNWGAWD